jgi:hypothetical protein
MTNLNQDVTRFLDELNHPLRDEIEKLRTIILGSVKGLSENIKWNGPNYVFNEQDRITMKIHPPKQVQLIFHRGAKKQEQPVEKLIKDNSGLLSWKENDRAVASFRTLGEIETNRSNLKEVITKWISAAK